jgi:3-hydroxybutyryl-CoA dehydrogenase
MSQPTNGHQQLERIAILGSGTIACGLARVASKNADVVLWARSEASAQRTAEKLGDAVTCTTDLQALSDRTLCVEAIVEDYEAKKPLLESVDTVLPDSSLSATTTSSLCVAELAKASKRPDRFAGIHVFNPVEKMPLVELVFPDEASETTRDRAHSLCSTLEKTAVEVPDLPGFVVNRLLFPYLFNAVRLLESTGLKPEAVDQCMTLGAGQPIGPLALLDFVGLDVASAIGESLGEEIPPLMSSLIAEGKLGKKTRQGFYTYQPKARA